MVDEKDLSGLASYLGKYADQVAFNIGPMSELNNHSYYVPLVRSDEYSLASYFKVRVQTQDGPVMQNVKLGPTELYAYPNGDQTLPAEFKGILDEAGRFIPCLKDENGDFLVPTTDGQIQILASAENLAERDKLTRSVYKLNYLNHEPVFQSEEKIRHPEGRDYQEPEAYTISHVSGDQLVGPIEYYTYPKDGKGKPEFVGILLDNGYVMPCTRNADGDFEFMDQNQEKQVIPSAESELKKDPNRPYKTFKTEYLKGQPVFQQMTEERGEEPQAVVIQPRPTPEELLSGPLNEPQDIQRHQMNTPSHRSGTHNLFSDPRAKDKISPKR